MCEHLGVSAATQKRVKVDNDSVIKKHDVFCNHSSDFDDFFILARNNNDFINGETFGQQRLPSLA